MAVLQFPLLASVCVGGGILVYELYMKMFEFQIPFVNLLSYYFGMFIDEL